MTGLDPALINSRAYLGLATNSGQETALGDFARELLHICGFEERGRVLRSRYTIPLSICGESNTVAQTDVCLLDRQYDLTRSIRGQDDFYSSNPEPQIIAEAIAAYQYNNDRRARMGLPVLNTMTIPCITMVGTRQPFT